MGGRVVLNGLRMEIIKSFADPFLEAVMASTDSSAKTLFAVLTPLATAITGYYFGSASGRNSDD